MISLDACLLHSRNTGYSSNSKNNSQEQKRSIMLAQRVISSSLRFSASMEMGMKAVACYEHTMSHIPIMKANMKRLDCVLNPSDKSKHNASVFLLIASFSLPR